jgi:hypothetical protein
MSDIVVSSFPRRRMGPRNLQVKNCQFWEFFYSLWRMGTRKSLKNVALPKNFKNIQIADI